MPGSRNGREHCGPARAAALTHITSATAPFPPTPLTYTLRSRVPLRPDWPQILRVFYDRLVDDKDRSWFLSYLRSVMKDKLSAGFDPLFAHLRAGDGGEGDGDAAGVEQPHAQQAQQGELTIEEVRRCFFGDYMDDAGEGG